MNCILCGMRMTTQESMPVFGDLVKNMDIKTDTYKCQCPVYYFDEIIYIRDNKVNLDKLNSHEREIFNGKFRIKKTYLNEIAEKTKIKYIDNARCIFNIKKNSNDYAGDLNRAIWGLIYKAERMSAN